MTASSSKLKDLVHCWGGKGEGDPYPALVFFLSLVVFRIRSLFLYFTCNDRQLITTTGKQTTP